MCWISGEIPDGNTTSYGALGFENCILEIAVFKRCFVPLRKREIGIQEITIYEFHIVQLSSHETTVIEIAILERGMGTFNPVAVSKDNVGFVKGTFFYSSGGKQGIVDIEIPSFNTG